MSTYERDAVDAALQKRVECNADVGHPCDANDGEPCAACVKWFREEEAYYRKQWLLAPLSERDPEKYRQEMQDAGRGHLLGEEP